MRRPSTPRFLLSAPALLLTVALLPAPAFAWSSDPTVNDPVCTTPLSQWSPVAASDGAGGMFVAWADERNGSNSDIYLSHQLKGGLLAPGWPANGLAVCTAADLQRYPAMIADGQGGVIVTWQDRRSASNYDIYAQRITSAGAVASGWTANGVLVGAATPGSLPRDEQFPKIASDGAGGAIIVWTLTYTFATDYDLYANHITAAGAVASGWTAGGKGITTSGAIQDAPAICSDGAGGAFIAYEDNFSGTYDVKMARATGAGTTTYASVDLSADQQTAPLIAPDGTGGTYIFYQAAFTGVNLIRMTGAMTIASGWAFQSVASYGSGSANPNDLVSDGSGGAYLSWTHYNFQYDPYLQHYGANAWLPGSWPAGGVLLPNGYGAGTNNGARLVPDGSGGVIAAYQTTTSGLQASRYLAGGAVASTWSSNGTTVSSANGSRDLPSIVTDGNSGALIAWEDYRAGNYDIYAERVERFGRLGDPEPVMAGAKDVLNDQGGQVRVSWLPSYLDADPVYGVSQYIVYRQAPARAAEAALRAGRAVIVAPEETVADAAGGGLRAETAAVSSAAGPTRYLVTRDAAQTTYWEQIASVAAQTLPAYSYVASTTGDSVGGSNPYTQFMVEATSYYGGFWFSSPDSGYSVDNLPPVAPAPFTGNFVPGTGALMTWGPNGEPDLAGYRLYKGYTEGFAPGPSSLIAQTTLANYTDPASHSAIYKLSAVDIHGNESRFASWVPSATTDVSAGVPRELFFAPVSPNPVCGSALLHYGLPRAGEVRLAIYDVQGRAVRVLAQGPQAAGEYSLRWDGAGAAGERAAAGLYFARLEAEGQTITRRLIAAR